ERLAVRAAAHLLEPGIGGHGRLIRFVLFEIAALELRLRAARAAEHRMPDAAEIGQRVELGEAEARAVDLEGGGAPRVAIVLRLRGRIDRQLRRSGLSAAGRSRT